MAFSVPAKAAQAQGTLTVSLQVLPSCATRVDRHTATVNCPSGYAFALSRTRAAPALHDIALTMPDTTFASPQTRIEDGTETVTIRY
jgi:hypothetical protein